MNRIILSLIILLISLSIYTQEKIKVNLYKTMDHYIEKSFSDTDVTLLVKEISESHIWFKKFIDEDTGKKIKKAHTS